MRVWKYNVDRSSHWFKRFYFSRIFLPFNRFSYDHFDLLPPTGKDADGRLCWIEEQGGYETEWQAEQEAAKYPFGFGHAVRVPLNTALPAETVKTQQISPGSPKPVREMYARNSNNGMTEVPKLSLARLAMKVESSNALVSGQARET